MRTLPPKRVLWGRPRRFFLRAMKGDLCVTGFYWFASLWSVFCGDVATLDPRRRPIPAVN